MVGEEGSEESGVSSDGPPAGEEGEKPAEKKKEKGGARVWLFGGKKKPKGEEGPKGEEKPGGGGMEEGT